MADQPGATPADTSDAATAEGDNEDARAQALLADAVDAKPAETGKDEPLGDAGKRALQAERERAKKLEKELAGYRKAEQDKADADKTEAEKRAAAEARAAAAEARALRLEVAAEKGLTASQAKRLVGSTREELEADADELLADFGTQQPAKKAAPKPDPSQGARGEPTPKRATSLTEALKRLPQFNPAGPG